MKKQKVAVIEGALVVQYPTIGKTFRAVLEAYPENIRLLAMEHGFKQKFGDAKSGESASEKYAEVQLIHTSLMAGEWERTAKPDLTPIICEAVSRIKKVAYDKVLSAAEGNEEQVKTWSQNPKVKAEIAQIRAERAAAAAEAADEEEIEIEL